MTESSIFPKNKPPGQTWEETLTHLSQWQRLPKQQRSTLIAKAKRRDKAERVSRQILENANQETHFPRPEESPFSIPDGMTPEQATVEKVRRDAETWPVIPIGQDKTTGKPTASRGTQEPARQPPEQQSREDVIKGPRGGKYRIDKNGKKRYDIP